MIQIPPKSPPANEILRQSRAKRRRAVGTVAVINRREARGGGGRVADRRETVIESRAARAFRRIAGRRVFPASNQAGIHRICCQSAAPFPPPSPPRVSALSGPRVRVTRRAMTRESTRLENRGILWCSRSCLRANFNQEGRGEEIKRRREEYGCFAVSGRPLTSSLLELVFMEALMDRMRLKRAFRRTRRRIMRYPLEES